MRTAGRSDSTEGQGSECRGAWLQVSAHVQDAGGPEAWVGGAGVRVFVRREGGLLSDESVADVCRNGEFMQRVLRLRLRQISCGSMISCQRTPLW